MTEVTLHLPVTIAKENHSEAAEIRQLWTREVHWDFLPGTDPNVDRVVLSPGGWSMTPVFRWFEVTTGMVKLEFARVWVDPLEHIEKRFAVGSSWSRRNTTWWTDRDGDLEAVLHDAGWR